MTASLGWPPIWGTFGSLERPSSPWQAAHWAILSASDCAPAVSLDPASTTARMEAANRIHPERADPLFAIRDAIDGARMVIGDQQRSIRQRQQVDRPAHILVVLLPARQERL